MQDQHTSSVDAATQEHAPLWTPTLRRRVLLFLIALLSILLLVVVPPSFSINRYQRRVATAISGALGRPVHFDSITLHLLPLPGLTISNFVVSENPEFGYEPVLRANTVEARLRLSSLWRRRIEVSRISLEGPSINLVRRPDDGRWNLQSILMQASQLHSAPTAQQRAGEAPRFPYIEATDARINLKSGDVKLPFSVSEAEFALWLPQPDQWRLRMVGKPVRTDTDVNDVGLLRVEATLGRAIDLASAPIMMEASWKPTPLGEAAKLTAGSDLGWRGEVSAGATLHGTLGQGKLTTEVHLRSLHRTDFLPEHNAELDVHCEAATAGLLRSLHDVRCAVPTDNSLSFAGMVDALRRLPSAGSTDESDFATVKPGVLLLQAEVPNVLDWQTATGTATLKHATATYALLWAELFTRSIPPALTLDGTVDFAGSLHAISAGEPRWAASLTCMCQLPRPAAQTPGVAADKANRWAVRFTLQDAPSQMTPTAVTVSATPASGAPESDAQLPTASSAPAAEPAQAAPVYGTLTHEGYTLHYASRADAEQAASLIPRLGEGLAEAATGPLEAQAGWYAPQTWTAAAPPARIPAARRHRRR